MPVVEDCPCSLKRWQFIIMHDIHNVYAIYTQLRTYTERERGRERESCTYTNSTLQYIHSITHTNSTLLYSTYTVLHTQTAHYIHSITSTHTVAVHETCTHINQCRSNLKSILITIEQPSLLFQQLLGIFMECRWL